MSSSSIIGIVGGVIGGVIGFFIGGPMGAVYGAGLGFGLGVGAGALMDPAAPDSNVGRPQVEDLHLTSAAEGVEIPDLNGTSKISQTNIIWQGADKTYEIKQEQPGGKGGPDSEEVVVGYDYYSSWAQLICAGPVDALYAIYNSEDLLWGGELLRPASGGMELFSLTGFGTIRFFFGTEDQEPPAHLIANLSDPTLSPGYRGYCWAYFENCYLGRTRRIPTIKFVPRKSPSCAFDPGDAYRDISIFTYEPYHSIYYALRNMCGLSAEWFDDESFLAAAETLKDENRGISILYDKAKSAQTYVQTLLNHARGLIRYGADGKFRPKLIRLEFSGDLPIVDENVMTGPPKISTGTWTNTVNEVKVQYTKAVEK